MLCFKESYFIVCMLWGIYLVGWGVMLNFYDFKKVCDILMKEICKL